MCKGSFNFLLNMMEISSFWSIANIPSCFRKATKLSPRMWLIPTLLIPRGVIFTSSVLIVNLVLWALRQNNESQVILTSSWHPTMLCPRMLSHLISVWLCVTPWTVACQARILEWVTIYSSRGSSIPRDRTHISYVSCIGRQVLYHSATWEAPKPPPESRFHKGERPVTSLCYITAFGGWLTVPHAGTWAKHIQSEFFSCIFQTGVGRAVSWEDWKLGGCVCCWLRPWHVVSILTEWKKGWMNRGAVISTLVSLTPSSLGKSFPYRNLIFSFTGDVHLLIIQAFSHMVKSG